MHDILHIMLPSFTFIAALQIEAAQIPFGKRRSYPNLPHVPQVGLLFALFACGHHLLGHKRPAYWNAY